jgi:hypothetical protein
MLPLPDAGTGADKAISAETALTQVESDPEAADSEGELASAESHPAGENDPAA